MFNLTKLKLLWDKMEEMAGRLRSDEKRLPPDYSADETPTGQKWIDGKMIYTKVLTGIVPDISGSSASFTIDNNPNYDTIILETTVYGLTTKAINRVSLSLGNYLQIYNIPSSASGTPYIVLLYYTKPEPANRETEPDQLTEVKSKRKTKKEEETK